MDDTQLLISLFGSMEQARQWVDEHDEYERMYTDIGGEG